MSIRANMLTRALWVDEIEDQGYPWPIQHVLAAVADNQFSHIGVRSDASVPRRLLILLRFWWANTAGEIGLFKLGPKGDQGPHA